MILQTSSRAEPNLTQLEVLALSSGINVSDGHARQELTEQQCRIVDEMATLFDEAARAPVEELESRCHSSFFGALQQNSFPAGPGRVLTCYSSSVAMEIFARSLTKSVSTIALIHPTFDNIPDILKGVGLNLIPIDEGILGSGDLKKVARSAGCIFVTTPNNPTGAVLAADRLSCLAELCADHGIVLALDTSFRGFEPASQYDNYEILEASGCRYVVIEDTGKLWPTLDLKVGLLVHNQKTGLPLEVIYSDILLGVSPFILQLVEAFSRDAASGGFKLLHDHIRTNRELLRGTLSSVPGVFFPDADSRVSVERVALNSSQRATEVCKRLRAQGIHMLPCRQFYWARPELGERFVRVALARPRTTVEAASAALRSVLLD